MRSRYLRWLSVAFVWAGVLPAAGAAPATGASQAAQTFEVDIIDFDFRPPDLDILVGDTVKWTNTGQTDHTVTMDGVWDSDEIAPGGIFTRTFDTPGTFDYHCHLHHGMEGRVQVREPGQPVADDDRAELVSGLPGSPASVLLNVLANDGDLEDDDITVIGNTQGARGGSAECDPDGSCTFTERGGACVESDSFTYTISDGTQTDRARVVIGITCSTTESHRRSISLVLKKHLVAEGEIGVPDGTGKCRRGRKVVISRGKDGSWAKVATTKTSRTGRYSVGLPDRPGKYKAVAKMTVLGPDVCEVAKAVRRHSH